MFGISTLGAKAFLPAIEKRVLEVVNPRKLPADFKEGRFLIVIGGGRISGKTTMMHHVLNKLVDEGYKREYVAKLSDAIFDDIMHMPFVQKVQNKLVDEYTLSWTREQNNVLTRLKDKAFATIRKRAFAQGSPVIVEDDMHKPAFISKLLEEARSQGYETLFIVPHVDMSVAFNRGEERLQTTGQTFMPHNVLYTHNGFAEHVDAYHKDFDAGVIVDNNAENTAPRLIAFSRHGQVIVKDEAAYAELRRKEHQKPEEALGRSSYGVDGRNRSSSKPADTGSVGARNAADTERNTAAIEGFAERLMRGFSEGERMR